MKISKGKIEEIIDGDGNIMGSVDRPEVSPNIETQASKTTDYNAKVHGQNFKNDFLGRFGFYFYESEGSEKPPVVEALEDVVGDKANAVMETIKPFLEEAFEGDGSMNESKVVEDKISPKKEDKLIPPDKKDKGLVGGNVEKVADLLGKLPKAELDKLINLLESKSSKKKTVTKPEGLKDKMKEVSLGQDDDGYYVYTHRARSSSYESPEKIPDSKIKFITSTG